MSILNALVAAQGQADERLMRSANYAANAWGGMMERRVYKAAGQDLINLMESTPPDKDITASDVMKIAQKWKLSEESMQKLMQQVKDSGALEVSQMQRRAARQQMQDQDAVRRAEPAIKRAMTQPSMESAMNQLNSLYPGKPGDEDYLPLSGILEPMKQMAEIKKAETKGEMTEFQAASIEARYAQIVQNAADKEAQRALQAQIAKDNQDLKLLLANMTLGKQNKLPANVVTDVSTKKDAIKQMLTLASTFKDNFGGSVIGGPTATKLYEKGGLNKERVYWWKQFKTLDSKLRNELFGSALTNTEKASWDEITVTENSHPTIIRNAVAHRAKIASDALQRQISDFGDAGYNVTNMNTGTELSPVQVIKYDSNGKRIQ